MFYYRLMVFPYGKRLCSFCCCFSYSLESFRRDSLNTVQLGCLEVWPWVPQDLLYYCSVTVVFKEIWAQFKNWWKYLFGFMFSNKTIVFKTLGWGFFSISCQKKTDRWKDSVKRHANTSQLSTQSKAAFTVALLVPIVHILFILRVRWHGVLWQNINL